LSMDIRTFQAETIREALDRVRRELGEDAVILHTRNVHRGGFLGFGKKTHVEVTASRDARILEPELQLSYEQHQYRRVAAEGPLRDSPGPVPPRTIAHDMVTEVRELRKLVETLSTEIDVKDLPEPAGRWVARLTECGVTKPVARQLVTAAARGLDDAEQAAGEEPFGEGVRAEISGMIRTTGGIADKGKRGARVIAMIGPTGVGKTTSIAKLASVLALNDKRRVAFVTADTYRIAATEQLRVYADLIHVPMDVVFGTDDMQDAIERHLQRDYVFIDTAGSSQFNEEQMAELCGYMKTAQCDEVHLLLSATTDLHEMGEIIERFSAVSPTCVLFTKIDETTRQGILLNTLAETELPVSYLSTGQNVPEDIELATADSVTAWVLGETESPSDGPGGQTASDG